MQESYSSQEPQVTHETRWAIIGCGDVCEHKGGPPLYRLPGQRLIACHRRNVALGHDYAARHGPCEFIEDPDELLQRQDIDVVYVATPPSQHEAHCLAAAAAGKAVLVEKPMASDTAACRRIVAACAAAEVTLAVAYYRRGYASVQRLRSWLQQRGPRLTGVLSLNDQFPTSHRIDLVHYWAGAITEMRLIEDTLPFRAEARGEVVVLHTESGLQVRMGLRWGELAQQAEHI
jgi:hypothetical protein